MSEKEMNEREREGVCVRKLKVFSIFKKKKKRNEINNEYDKPALY